MRARIAIPPKSQGENRSTHTAVPKSPQVSFQSPQNKTKAFQAPPEGSSRLGGRHPGLGQPSKQKLLPLCLLLFTSTSHAPRFIFNFSATTPTWSAAPTGHQACIRLLTKVVTFAPDTRQQPPHPAWQGWRQKLSRSHGHPQCPPSQPAHTWHYWTLWKRSNPHRSH